MPEEPTQESKKSAKFALFIALLALSFTAIGITAGYKHWLRIHIKTKEALTEIKLLKEKMAHTADKKALSAFEASFKSTTNQERETLEKALAKLDHVSKQTDYAASTVSQQIEALTAQQEQANNTTKPRIQQAYVPFILQTAQRQLHFLHDKKGALALLKIADQMLIEAGSKNHLVLRQRIAADIAALQHYKAIDIETISATISQLETEIPPLMAIEDKNIDENTSEIAKETRTLTTNIKNYLKQSITLRKTNEPPRQLLATGDQKRIDQLIQLRLESLHLMLLQRQNKAYHWQINRLIKTLTRYYPAKQAAPWINTLEGLANIQLNPPAPALTSSKKSPFPFKQEK
jgi:uncharacterized protein HemX